MWFYIATKASTDSVFGSLWVKMSTNVAFVLRIEDKTASNIVFHDVIFAAFSLNHGVSGSVSMSLFLPVDSGLTCVVEW